MAGLVSAPVMPLLGGNPGVVTSEANYGDEIRYGVETSRGTATLKREEFEILTAGDAEDRGCNIKYVEEADRGTHVNCDGVGIFHLSRRIPFFMVSVSRIPSGYCPLCNTYYFGPMEGSR